MDKKLRQLDIDLLFLKLRIQQKHQQPEEYPIECLVALAFLILPEEPNVAGLVETKLEKGKRKYSLLYKLCELGKFGLYFGDADIRTLMRTVGATAHHTHSSLTSLTDEVAREREVRQELEEQIEQMRQQFHRLEQNQQKSQQENQELRRMILDLQQSNRDVLAQVSNQQKKKKLKIKCPIL